MSQSRKQVLAQIDSLNRKLQRSQRQVATQKYYFKQHSLMMFAAILIPVTWMGWKMRGKHWVNKLAIGVTDMVTLVFMNYFKQQLVSLLSNVRGSHQDALKEPGLD